MIILRFPIDLTEELWKYYSALGCVTFLEDKKLLVLVSISLLDRMNMFEIYQVINSTIPSHQVEQKLKKIAKYKIKTEFIALNPARTRFMLLTSEEAKKCKIDTLGTCSAASPIYVAGNDRL